MTAAARRPAFITGGSSGIGLELAKQLSARGHPVALFARDPGRLQAAVEAIGPSAFAYPCDVSDAAACAEAVARAIADLGAPGHAVANAGITEPGEFLGQSIALHRRHMEVNYMGALHFAHACTPHMGPGARLIFVSSVAAFFGIYGYSAYAPTKFAMRGLAEVLRVELAPRGITVTIAYPADTDTPLLAAEAASKPEITRKITESGGTWRTADVAGLILTRADRGRFTATPGMQATLLLHLHSLLAPLLRRWQARIVRRAGSGR